MSALVREMSEADMLAAIRANHLKANVGHHEQRSPDDVHWDRAWIDPGGTIFGRGPYAKVPITLRNEDGDRWDEIVVRVYPPERLRRHLAKQWLGAHEEAEKP